MLVYSMQYAFDRRLNRVVHADEVSWSESRRVYECPVCRADVHYRRAMGLSPDPGFAHNAHAAKEDCELFHPTSSEDTTKSLLGSAAMAESFAKIELCLDDQAQWSLFLRFPEIADLGEVRLRSLTAAAITVTNGNRFNNLPLIELRPGTGTGRLLVSPSLRAYDTSPSGQWPAELSPERWKTSCGGLNPRGTAFAMKRGEWQRIREGAEIELGSELRILAISGYQPPAACSPEAGLQKIYDGVTWRVWQAFLPHIISREINSWSEALRVKLVPACDEIMIVAIPQSFDSDGPLYSQKDQLIARLKWAPDDGPAALTLRNPDFKRDIVRMGSDATSRVSLCDA